MTTGGLDALIEYVDNAVVVHLDTASDQQGAEDSGVVLFIIFIHRKQMKHIQTEHAPAAIGPYSQAVATDSLLFVSGQIALVPGTDELRGDTGATQIVQCLRNLEAILRSDGLSVGDIVKTTIFVVNMDEFADINLVYHSVFGEHKPARSTVGVSSLPRGALVEIEAIARRCAPANRLL